MTETQSPIRATTRKGAGCIDTVWELRTYDVWGNPKDGFEVNDCCVIDRRFELRLSVTVYNVGSDQEFRGASPSDAQIRRAFGLTNIQLETDGDDLTVYVNRARDGYPIGEMHCESHDSLSPIRRKPA